MEEYKPDYNSGYPGEEEWDWCREQGNGKGEPPFFKLWSFDFFYSKDTFRYHLYDFILFKKIKYWVKTI